MKKLKLDLDSLTVETFTTTPSEGAPSGAVVGQSVLPDSADHSGCATHGFSCYPEEESCGEQCPGPTERDTCVPCYITDDTCYAYQPGCTWGWCTGG